MDDEKPTEAKVEALELANAIQSIGLQVHDAVDPNQVIQRVATRIREATRASFVGIALVDATAGLIVRKWGALVDGGTVPPGPVQPIGQGVVGRAAATGETVSVPDVAKYEGYVDLVPGIRSELAIPLRHGSKVVGVLDLESRQADAFGAEAVAALEGLASAVTLAVQNARLVQEERKRLGQLTLLSRISRVMTSTVDVDELLDRTARSIRELLAYDVVVIGLLDDRTQRAVVRAVSAAVPAEIELGRAVAMGEGVTGGVLESGRSVLIPDVARHEGYVTIYHGIESEMCVPLKSGDRAFGFLDAESTRPGAFDEADLVILEALAEHISRAVENAESLRRMAKVRDELATVVVEQLKRPISSVRVALEGLGLDLERLCGETALEASSGDRLRSWIRGAESSCSELMVMVDSLADINALEGGKLRLTIEHTTPTTILMAVWERMSVMAESRGIGLASRIEEGLPALTLDGRLMARVLQNLLVAALQLTPKDGEVLVEVASAPAEVLARLPGAARGLLFTVRHRGHTIPDSALPQLFEKFRVIDSGQAGQKYRTGLGLAFCREAVAAHGGALWAEGLAEGGNAFHVLLPLGEG